MNYLPSIIQVAILGFAGLTIAAAFSDTRSLTIPNRYCLAIALLYPIYALQAQQTADWLAAIGIAGAVLAVGFLLFARNLIGGGDAKLVAAVALWAGPGLFVDFLVITGIAGGALAFVLWLRHRLSRAAAPALVFVTEADPDFVKQPMPYGVAIAAGGLYVAFTLIS